MIDLRNQILFQVSRAARSYSVSKKTTNCLSNRRLSTSNNSLKRSKGFSTSPNQFIFHLKELMSLHDVFVHPLRFDFTHDLAISGSVKPLRLDGRSRRHDPSPHPLSGPWLSSILGISDHSDCNVSAIRGPRRENKNQDFTFISSG